MKRKLTKLAVSAGVLGTASLLTYLESSGDNSPSEVGESKALILQEAGGSLMESAKEVAEAALPCIKHVLANAIKMGYKLLLKQVFGFDGSEVTAYSEDGIPMILTGLELCDGTVIDDPEEASKILGETLG